MSPYAIVSDLHLHNHSQFAKYDEHGVSSRLSYLLQEWRRAATILKEQDGKRMYVAGDLFHVRDRLSPSVLVPTIETAKYITQTLDIELRIIPGNHDLATRESRWYHNASSALYQLDGVEVCVEPTYFKDDHVFMAPWIESVKALHDWITNTEAGDADLIIHAPMNGVIKGIPDHGLDPAKLIHSKFKRIFCGHYHNHRSFYDRVYSIGALAHHDFGDVDSEAGFIIVDADVVTFNYSQAPKFVDFDLQSKTEDVNGNYVRAKVDPGANVKDFEETLLGWGALGAVIYPTAQQQVARDNATIQAGMSLEASIHEWIKGNKPNSVALPSYCESLLKESEDV